MSLETAPERQPERRDPVDAGPATAGLAMVKRLLLCALVTLMAGSAVAAIIALKAVIYLSRFNYH
jgi:hypothetical protein